MEQHVAHSTPVASMGDPYAPPQASVHPPATLPESFGLLFWIIAGAATLLAFCLGIIGTFVVPVFADVFDSFGADLAAPTALLFAGRHWLWLSTLVAACMWVIWLIYSSRYEWRGRFILGFSLFGIFNLSLMAALIWALYLPIFRMSVVQL